MKTEVYVSKTSGLKVVSPNSNTVIVGIDETSFPRPQLDLLKSKPADKRHT